MNIGTQTAKPSLSAALRELFDLLKPLPPVPTMPVLDACAAYNHDAKMRVKDLVQIQELYIKGIDESLDQLDEIFTAARTYQQNVQQRKDSAKDVLAILNSSIAPVHSLPPEVLAEIFIVSVWLSGHNTIDTDSPPWTLAKVCHAWRKVCLSTPRIWRRIGFGLQVSDKGPLIQTMSRLSSPLSLSISVPWSGNISRAWSQLDVQRIKHLHCSIGTDDLGCLSTGSVSFPAVENLSIKVTNEARREEGDHISALAFSNVTRLELLLTDFPMYNYFTARELRALGFRGLNLTNWSKLTFFSGPIKSAEPFLLLLQSLPCLQNCRAHTRSQLVGSPRDADVYHREDPFVHTQLRHLALVELKKEKHPRDLNVLKSFSFPSLTRACLSWQESTSFEDRNAMHFFDCMSTSLTMLYLSFSVPSDLLLNILRSCSKIEWLRAANMSTEILELLTDHPSEEREAAVAWTPLLPHIQHLWIYPRILDVDSIDPVAVNRMAKSRVVDRKAPTQFRTLEQLLLEAPGADAYMRQLMGVSDELTEKICLWGSVATEIITPALSEDGAESDQQSHLFGSDSRDAWEDRVERWDLFLNMLEEVPSTVGLVQYIELEKGVIDEAIVDIVERLSQHSGPLDQTMSSLECSQDRNQKEKMVFRRANHILNVWKSFRKETSSWVLHGKRVSYWHGEMSHSDDYVLFWLRKAFLA